MIRSRLAKDGEVLGVKLRALKDRHPSVGDVRGLGLFWGIELVKNRATKEPFGTFHDKYARKPMLIDQVTGELMKQGVYSVGWISHLVLAPPLIVTEAQLDEAVAALDVALKITDAQVQA